MIYTGGFCIGGFHFRYGWRFTRIVLEACEPPQWGGFDDFLFVVFIFLCLLIFFIIVGGIVCLPIYLFLKYKKKKSELKIEESNYSEHI